MGKFYGKFSLLLLIIALLFLLYIITPVYVEGTVESKAINGRMSGNIVKGILSNMPYPGEPWILVEDKDFEQFFSPEDKNVFINDSLHELMDRKYVSIDYIVAIEVSSEDPVNDVGERETCAYLTDREDFNRAKIGDKVLCKVSRFDIARIEEITVL